MQHLNIREMRSVLGKLEQLVEEQKELVITRNKQEIARILPMQSKKQRPTHIQLRQLTDANPVSVTELIRLDRDGR